MTRDELRVVFNILKNSYQKFNTSEEVFNTWYSFLASADSKKISSAVRSHIAESRFQPTISDITSRCTSLGGFRDKTEYPMPAHAQWEYKKMMHKKGWATIRTKTSAGIPILVYKKISECMSTGVEYFGDEELPTYAPIDYFAQGAA